MSVIIWCVAVIIRLTCYHLRRLHLQRRHLLHQGLADFLSRTRGQLFHDLWVAHNPISYSSDFFLLPFKGFFKILNLGALQKQSMGSSLCGSVVNELDENP